MNNKYLYLFQKDVTFRTLSILSLAGVVSCLFLIRLQLGQTMELQDIQGKQSLINQIPFFQSKLVQTKVIVNQGITLTLNGIISDNTRTMAVINNKLLKFEEVIDGQRLVTITSKSATLCDVKSDKCITLYLEK